MKSSIAKIIILSSLVGFIFGCGQTGPLYLPPCQSPPVPVHPVVDN